MDDLFHIHHEGWAAQVDVWVEVVLLALAQGVFVMAGIGRQQRLLGGIAFPQGVLLLRRELEQRGCLCHVRTSFHTLISRQIL